MEAERYTVQTLIDRAVVPIQKRVGLLFSEVDFDQRKEEELFALMHLQEEIFHLRPVTLELISRSDNVYQLLEITPEVYRTEMEKAVHLLYH